MLNIDIKMYGDKKNDITEEKFQTFFNHHLNKVYVTSEAHRIYQVWAESRYMSINGIGNTVYVNCGLEVPKRKLTENTKLLTNRLMEQLVKNYENKLNNIHIEIEVEDDSGRYYEIGNN